MYLDLKSNPIPHYIASTSPFWLVYALCSYKPTYLSSMDYKALKSPLLLVKLYLVLTKRLEKPTDGGSIIHIPPRQQTPVLSASFPSWAPWRCTYIYLFIWCINIIYIYMYVCMIMMMYLYLSIGFYLIITSLSLWRLVGPILHPEVTSPRGSRWSRSYTASHSAGAVAIMGRSWTKHQETESKVENSTLVRFIAIC